MEREELEQLLREEYGVEPDYPWLDAPDYGVFRHNANRKWFALIMTLPKNRLGLAGEGKIDVVNLKVDPILLGSVLHEPGFFPAYHMSKTHWVTAALDGSADRERLLWLLDMSFEMTRPKRKRKKGGAI